MSRQEKLPASVSSEEPILGDTGMPDTTDGGIMSAGTSDVPLGDDTSTFSTTWPEVFEKSLHTKKFFRPKFLLRLIVLGWFGVACWILISDQNNGHLTGVEDLKFFGVKIGVLSLIGLVAMLFSWIFADRNE